MHSESGDDDDDQLVRERWYDSDRDSSSTSWRSYSHFFRPGGVRHPVHPVATPMLTVDNEVIAKSFDTMFFW